MFMTEVCEYEYIIIVYCNTAHELKGTVMKTKSIWVGYVIKFIIHATWASKWLHMKEYIDS